MDEYLNGYKLMFKLRKDYFMIFHVVPKLIWVVSMIYIIYSFRVIYLTAFSIDPYLYILVFSFLLYISFKGEKHLFKLKEKNLKLNMVNLKNQLIN